MNSQDITRALIDTTVARAMVEMDADPKRSVRKLCDLGRQFSRGRFQNQIFAIFQDLLRNDESPYYQAIDFLLRSNDPEALRQFGINIGYNSFTYGAQILRQKQKELSFAVPWVVKLRLDSRIPDTYDSSFFASVVRTGLTYGITLISSAPWIIMRIWNPTLPLSSRIRNARFSGFFPIRRLPKNSRNCFYPART